MDLSLIITTGFISLLNLSLIAQYLVELFRTKQQLKETDGTFRYWLMIRKKSLIKQIVLLMINFAYATVIYFTR